MSTIFNVRNLKVPRMSRTTIVVVAIVAIAALGAALFGRHVYRELTTTTVVAEFPETLALYPGDKVQILGVRVGTIDAIEPAGDRMRVTFHYASKFKVPQNVTASILNPSLVASRTIQLSPPYSGGPVLQDGAVIPLTRTQVPAEWDDLRDQAARAVTKLGPSAAQPKGPFGDLIESFADGFAGKGEQFNAALKNLSEAVTALNERRGSLFDVVRSLALFVNTLHLNDREFTALNTDLATATNALDNSNQELAEGIRTFKSLLATTRSLLGKNGDVTVTNVNQLSEVTTALVQPEAVAGLETSLHVLPNFAANFANIYSPSNGALTGVPVITNFANPMQFLCSAIQSASRLGYQDSAELCAEYLAPILDAIKFNYPPFGLNAITTASTLPKHIAYSEDRLWPPDGFKDTTVPGIFARDTLFSHGNHEPGWVVAPGMQGVQLQDLTKNMLTPESLGALLGAPAAAAPPPATAQPDAPLPAEEGGS